VTAITDLPVSLPGVARGAAVVILGGLLVLSCGYFFSRSSLKTDLEVVAFVPATTSLHDGDKIRLDTRMVARIDTLEVAGIVVPLSISRANVNETPATVTMTASDGPVEIAPGFSAQLEHDGRLSLAFGSDSVMLRPERDRQWLVQGGPARLRGRRIPVHALLEQAGFLIRLPGPEPAVRARIAVDTMAIAQALKGRLQLATAGIRGLLGPGARIESGSGLGLTKGGIQLRLAPFGQSPTWVKRRIPEIAFLETSDLTETLQALAGYLTSPSAMYAEPTNRFERAIDDANGSLAETRLTANTVASLVATLNTLVKDGGWLTHAVLDTTHEAQVDSAIEAVTAAIRGPGGIPRIDATLQHVAAAVARIDTSVIPRVDTTVKRLDSAIVRIGPRAETVVARGDTAVSAANQAIHKSKFLAVGLVGVGVLTLLGIIHRAAHFP
jgi:hypothetical protein